MLKYSLGSLFLLFYVVFSELLSWLRVLVASTDLLMLQPAPILAENDSRFEESSCQIRRVFFSLQILFSFLNRYKTDLN